jgi:hypothetical protein
VGGRRARSEKLSRPIQFVEPRARRSARGFFVLLARPLDQFLASNCQLLIRNNSVAENARPHPGPLRRGALPLNQGRVCDGAALLLIVIIIVIVLSSVLWRLRVRRLRAALIQRQQGEGEPSSYCIDTAY